MNVIVVDDEPLALRGIERLMREADAQMDLRAFSLPRLALDHARENRVDAAFLDIDMPGMSGLELAKELKDIDPDTHIVFVTSYEQYALDAFSVRATGYLLKPARLEDVQRELAFIGDGRRNGRSGQADQLGRSGRERKIRVRTFGGFEAEAAGMPLAFRRSKTKELLALLIDRRGCGVTTREACAVLWEDAPYGASQRSYYQTLVADLRAALAATGAEDVLVRSRNSLAIDPALIDCDSYRFLEGDVVAVNSYRGDYLPAYSWAEYSVGRFGG